jgi:hypothetical protein
LRWSAPLALVLALTACADLAGARIAPEEVTFATTVEAVEPDQVSIGGADVDPGDALTLVTVRWDATEAEFLEGDWRFFVDWDEAAWSRAGSSAEPDDGDVTAALAGRSDGVDDDAPSFVTPVTAEGELQVLLRAEDEDAAAPADVEVVVGFSRGDRAFWTQPLPVDTQT